MMTVLTHTTDLAAELGVAPHKLVPPRIAATALDRRRLFSRLDTAKTRSIVVIAGAGYGKSCLLSSWAEIRDVSTAWLSVDAADNDPVRLVRSVAACLQTVVAADDLLRMGRDVRPETVERSLARIELLLRGAKAFVLVIDDAHVIVDSAACQVLDQLIDLIPSGSQIVVAARSEPGIRVARRVLAEELTIIEAQDLLFSDAESSMVLDEFADRLDPAVIENLTNQIAGWPAGIQFAALGLRSAIAADSTMGSGSFPTGELLTRYFQQEFLRSLDDDDREFLIHTSVLDHLSGDLCQHVVAEPDSAVRLEQLVRSGNVFVVPAGRSGTYRYHPLFADVLTAELRHADPEAEGPLRRRAIEWHTSRGESVEAVGQALASDGLIDPVPLIFTSVAPLISTGQVGTIGRWLGIFAPAEIRSNALLALAAAWHALFTNQSQETERYLAAALTAPFDGPLPDGTVDVLTAVSAVRMLKGDDGVIATARHANIVRSAGAGGGEWAGVASLLECVALHMAGLLDTPHDAYEQAEFETRGFAAAHAVTLAHMSLESLAHRENERAADEIRAASQEVERAGLREFGPIAFVFAVKSVHEARRGDFDSSRVTSDHVEYLLGLLDTVHRRSHIHHKLVLADAAILRNEWASAQRLLRTAEQLLPQEPDAVVLHEWAARLAHRCASNQRLGNLVELTAAEHRVLEQLATHRTLAEIGETLYVSRNTVKTHTVAIYRKLHVSGRSDAVERSIELGLLDIRLDRDRAAANLG